MVNLSSSVQLIQHFRVLWASSFRLPKILMRKLFFILCLVTSSPIFADTTGKLQFMYSAFLDVQNLFPRTLAACARAAPDTAEPLQNLVDQWKLEHGVFQTELQQLIRQILVKQSGDEKADALIVQIRNSVDKQIAPLYFPQNHEFKDDYFCRRLLPSDLKGDGLPLKFGDYVRDLRKTAP